MQKFKPVNQDLGITFDTVKFTFGLKGLCHMKFRALVDLMFISELGT